MAVKTPSLESKAPFRSRNFHEPQPNAQNQEIIKVREWIPHTGPLTKVILLKLFLDIVPSSSEEATRAMRGQQVEARRNGGNVILYVSISFQNRDVFWTLGRLFGRPGFRLFCAHLAVLFIRF